MAFETIETGRGGVQAWECDENAHLNVQFYTARISEATAALAHEIGVGHPAIDRRRGLVALAHHGRYLKELRVGDITWTRSRVVEMRERGLVSHHEIVRGDEVVASFVALDGHWDYEGGAFVAWNEAERERAAALTSTLPAAAAPRSVTLEGTLATLRLERAVALGLAPIHRGWVQPWHCLADGTMAPQHVVSRISDGVPHLWDSLGLGRAQMLDQGRGSIVLESRFSYVRPVRAGDLLAGRSALVEVMGKTLRFNHFLFDARHGDVIGAGEAVVAILDLAARRIAGFTEAEQAMLAPHVKVLG
ncbi:thioesterase family protein [Zavarzinia sp. CC-PAN008]|uniref:thioesterase family protein n=1 Tax=Zavarzinia sp. CC-PAN008 TaxID=3243332 RepID=UPI003F746312